MADENIFRPGLDGVVVAQTAISEVDGEHGSLTYHGYTIGELAERVEYEEIAHLLLLGHLPTRAELDAFKARLAAQRDLPETLLGIIRALPHDADPMDVLRTAVSAFGTIARTNGKATLDQAITYTAIFPTIVAAFHRYRTGQAPVAPNSALNHAANYLYMLNGQTPEANRVTSLNNYLVLLADHGMNASTFAARAVTSTESDLCSAITGAISSLKGPLHGGAVGNVSKMLQAVGAPENAQAWVTHELDNKGKIMGLGHRVYKTYDPRAEILREIARKVGNPQLFATAQATEQAALDELHRRKPQERIWTNVDFYSAVLLDSAGLPADLFIPTFGVSRVVGWSAHVLEQIQKNRLMRPEADYIGPHGAHWAPVDQRAGE
jgi:citrate synthase